MRRAGLAAIALTTALVSASGLAAQEPPAMRVLGGEHTEFTRLVVHAGTAVEWSLSPDGRTALLQIGPEGAPIDLSRAFERIPRTRLAALERAEGGIRLRLNCECPIRAFSDRPELVVLDILDAQPESAAGAQDDAGAATEAMAEPAAPTLPTGAMIGRDAGSALARRWSRHGAETAAATGPALALPSAGRATPPPRATAAAPETVDRGALRGALQTALAQAIGAGLMTGEDYLLAEMNQPAPEPGAADSPRGQMRIAPPAAPDTPLAGAAPPARAAQPDRPDPKCHAQGALDFLAAPDPPDFNAALAELMRRLYGEFDRPDADARAELVRHYLRAGMGAEARLLIDNARHPVAGHDLLRGLADILDDRQTNARQALAGLSGCPGPAGMLAALAGPAPSGLAEHAEEVALAHADAPPALRRLFGPPLVERLIEVGAIESARVIAATLHHTGPAGTVRPALPEALLEGARGAPDRAAESLAAQPGTGDADTLLRRLEYLLEAGTAADAALLDQAEAVAAAERHGAKGAPLMAATIRHDTMRGAHEAGFERLDRLRGWLRRDRQARQLLDGLRDALWQGIAEDGDDRRFLALILGRDDWRADQRRAHTRSALAERLLDLGLAGPAGELLDPPGDDRQRRLLARARLAGGQPEEAIALLTPMMEAAPGGADMRTGLLLARALRAAGATDAALVAYTELGAFDEAARTAIARRDWQALAELAQRNGADGAPDAAASGEAGPAAASADTGPYAGDAGGAGGAGRVNSNDPLAARAGQTPAPAMFERLAPLLGSEPASIAAMPGLLQAAQAAEAAGPTPSPAALPSAAENASGGAGMGDSGIGDSGQDMGDAETGNPAAAANGGVFAAADDLGIAVGDEEDRLMLRRNDALLDQSAELRGAIDALLQGERP